MSGVRFVTPGNVVVTKWPTISAFEIRLSSPQIRDLLRSMNRDSGMRIKTFVRYHENPAKRTTSGSPFAMARSPGAVLNPALLEESCSSLVSLTPLGHAWVGRIDCIFRAFDTTKSAQKSL